MLYNTAQIHFKVFFLFLMKYIIQFSIHCVTMHTLIAYKILTSSILFLITISMTGIMTTPMMTSPHPTMLATITRFFVDHAISIFYHTAFLSLITKQWISFDKIFTYVCPVIYKLLETPSESSIFSSINKP